MKRLTVSDLRELFAVSPFIRWIGLVALSAAVVFACRSQPQEIAAERSPIPFASVPAAAIFEPTVAKDQVGVFVAGGLINTFNDPFIHQATAGDQLKISLAGQSRRQPVFGVRLIDQPAATLADYHLEFTVGGRLIQPVGAASSGNPEIRQWVWSLRDLPGPYRLTILRSCRLSVGWGDGEVNWYSLPSPQGLAAQQSADTQTSHP